jgi:phosphomevalonate kinase
MCNQCINQYEIMLGAKASASSTENVLKELENSRSEVLNEEKMRVQLIGRLRPQEVS